MTVRPFDVHASHPPHAVLAYNRRRRQMTRIGWILGRCIRHEPVPYEAYRTRFAEPEHAFRSDVARLRHARIYRGQQLIGSDVS
jgi:hypothetical protein